MTAFTPEQWAKAGEFIARRCAEQAGFEPSDEYLREARAAAVWIATGRKAEEPR